MWVRMASLESIAFQLGVSKATISRAFDPRYCHKVRQETRQRIFELCERLSYHPTFTGRSFSTGRTYKIGLIAQHENPPIFSPIRMLCLHSLSRTAQEHGYAVTLLDFEDRDASIKISEFLRSSIADGYVIFSHLIDERAQEAILNCGKPVLSIDFLQRGKDGIPVVYRDCIPAYREAWSALPRDFRNSTAWVQVGDSDYKYRMLLQAAPENVTVSRLFLGDSLDNYLLNYRNDHRLAMAHLDELRKYRMLWCASDMQALAVADAFRENGIEPGKDVWIVGFDNIEGTTAGKHEQFLSTVDPCWNDFGARLGQMLLEKIENGREMPMSTAFPSRFIFRKSFPGKPHQGGQGCSEEKGLAGSSPSQS